MGTNRLGPWWSLKEILDELDGIQGDIGGLQDQIDELEGEDHDIQALWFETVASGTSGTITPPTGATIELDQWAAGVDCLVSGISGGTPTFESLYTAGGVRITGTLDGAGNWTISGTPAGGYPLAILYVYTVGQGDFDTDYSLESAQVTRRPIEGPESSTDNAIVRFDGATGAIVQDSGVLLDDTGNMKFPDGAAIRDVSGNDVIVINDSGEVGMWSNGAQLGYWDGDNDEIYLSPGMDSGVGGSLNIYGSSYPYFSLSAVEQGVWYHAVESKSDIGVRRLDASSFETINCAVMRSGDDTGDKPIWTTIFTTDGVSMRFWDGALSTPATQILNVTRSGMVLSGSFQIGTSTNVTGILDEDNMVSDSDTALATQQSIKKYVDDQVGAVTLDKIEEGNSSVEVVDAGTGQVNIAVDGANRVTIAETAVQFTSGVNVTIAGDLTVNGTTTTINTDELQVEDNLILINNGEAGAGVTAGTAGMQVDRGSLTDYQFLFDESDDRFKIGVIGSLQAVATREDSPTNNYVAYWNSTSNRFDTALSMTYSSIASAISASHARSHAVTSTSDHTAGNWKNLYTNGSGQIVELALGTATRVLKSGGPAAAPSWGQVAHSELSGIGANDHHNRSHAMTGTSDHTATNWRLFHSNGSGQVAELALGAANTLLVSAGASAAPTFSSTLAGLTLTSPTINTTITLGNAAKMNWTDTLSANLTGTGDVVTETVDTNAFGIGAALYKKSNGNWAEAGTASVTTAPCTALALSASTGAVNILLRGFLRRDTWSWTVGGLIYLSTTGALTQTAPTTSGYQVQVVGIAWTSTIIYFNPSLVLVENA